jgi:hypothetical protein
LGWAGWELYAAEEEEEEEEEVSQRSPNGFL